MVDRILVTGGAGFVGSHVAEYYAENGKEVTVLDNFGRVEMLEKADETVDTPKYNESYLDNKFSNIDFVEGDVRDEEIVKDVIEGKDAIVHLAGQTANTQSMRTPRLDFEINAKGTLNILEEANRSESDPAIVYASTNQVYGQNVNDIPLDEKDQRFVFADDKYSEGLSEGFPIDHTVHDPYGVSKLTGDMYVQDYDKRTNLDATALRLSCIYGPRQFGNEDQGWVAHFAMSALRDQSFTIFGNGKQVRDVLYVDDLVNAIDSILSDPDGKSSVYNIGGGPEHTTSLLEFIDLIEEITGEQPSYSFDDWWEGDQRIWISDIRRAKNELNWEPKTSFEDGLEKYIDWAETAV